MEDRRIQLVDKSGNVKAAKKLKKKEEKNHYSLEECILLIQKIKKIKFSSQYL